MNYPAHDSSLRRTAYTLLIIAAAAIAAARIASVTRLPMATFADNDRSRWATVQALVDHGTYAIGRRTGQRDPQGKPIDEGLVTDDGWQTIDKVLRPDNQSFYSSKPPLLATVVAGEYWLLKRTAGWSIMADRWRVVPAILFTFNWIPLIAYLVLLVRLVERFGTTDWGRLFIVVAGSFATSLTTFMNTLNNHTLATCAALFALYPFMRIWYDQTVNGNLYLTAGFFAGVTAALELPAAALVALLGLTLLVRNPMRTLLLFAPAALVPLAVFFATNYLAVGRWSPAYAEFGGPWYEFEGSVWAIQPGEMKQGIDWAYQTEGPLRYAFHVLVGHHGIFSLSPIYLLALGGALSSLLNAFTTAAEQAQGGLQPRCANFKVVAALTIALSGIVVGFYIFGVNERNRNYGGWTNGLRWLMWLTPLWLTAMLPAVDWLSGRRWGRWMAYAFLAASIFSASYLPSNPWRHPWLYDLMESGGWIRY